MYHLDLFTGIGGFSLAAREVWGDEHTIISFCEVDRRCRDFLSRAWPGVPCHKDIKTLDARKWLGRVDLLSAGVPCQPASRAGKQKGKEDDRWLWDETLRVVEECKPTWLLFENPPGIQDVGLDGILAELEGKGYEIGILDIPACAVDAPHIRSRLWIVGYSSHVGPEGQRWDRETGIAEPSENDMAHCSENGRRAWSQRNMECDKLLSAKPSLWEREGNTKSDMAHRVMPGLEGSKSESGDDESQQPASERSADEYVADASGTGSDYTANQTPTEQDRFGAYGGVYLGSYRFQGQWDNCSWLPCADGKVRRAPDDSIGMAYGLPVELSEALGTEGRQTPEDCEPTRSLLGALGNSIVWQVAVKIMMAIKAAMSTGIKDGHD
jgi:site-specific DNA-cytosine methylase